jgi:hypothetical protein
MFSVVIKQKYDGIDDYRALGFWLASEFYDRVTENIHTNKFGYANSIETVKSKGGGVPMIDTGELLGSIIANDNRVEYRQGTHRSGLSFSYLGEIMEFGRRDKGFNGFPVWRDTLEEFKKDLPQLIEKYKQHANRFQDS